MNHVLIVAYYFPPIAASGAMRPLGFCRHLVAHGWQSSVLTTTPDSVYPSHPVDEQLEKCVPADVRVQRVGYRDSLSRLLDMRESIRNAFQNWVGSRHRVGKTSGSRDPLLHSECRSRSVIKDAALDWLFAFPDRQASWMSPAVRRIISLKDAIKPDAILATGGPWTNFLVGKALARRFQCPLILDYRDPWTCNPYYSFGVQFLTDKARRLERALCLGAAHVIANTEELRQKLCDEYPEIEHRCTTIPNGYDPEILGTGGVNSANKPETYGKGYELCHFGTVYGKRTPGKLFQAIWGLYQEGLLKPEQVRLRFVGAWETTDNECNKLAGTLEKEGFLKRECAISHELCVRQMKQASVLLVIQPESPLQVPGKIYEYIAVSRPLVLIGGEGATASLVERYNLGVTWPNDVTGLKKRIHEIASGQVFLNPPSQHNVDQFSYRSLGGTLAGLLNACLDK